MHIERFSLAILELSAYVKQLLFFSIIAGLLLPAAYASPAFFAAAIISLSVIVALVEVSIAKMRLFRVIDFIAFAGILSILSVVGVIMGI